MNAEWFETLPEQCPPKDATQCDGCYYRIAMVILLQQKISFRKENYSRIKYLKD